MINKIAILDTSVATRNVGDEIIVDSVKRELNKIFNKNTLFYSIPTHEVISRHSRRIVNQSNLAFVAGTNLLSSYFHLLKANQWNINLYDAITMNNVVLMGVGWADYQKKANYLSRLIYKNVLDRNNLHSVRDTYTRNKLIELGFDNVINTGCPTMWELSSDHCNSIPKFKAEQVVMTLTDYRKDENRDKKLIDILLRNYSKVYLWLQGDKDYEYAKSLTSKVELVDPTLNAYDEILSINNDVDYVGTRLHAGIRALQKKRRTVVIGIDNRAIEKKRDFNINVIERNNIDVLDQYLTGDITTSIKLDSKAIEQWKAQFLTIEKI